MKAPRLHRLEVAFLVWLAVPFLFVQALPSLQAGPARKIYYVSGQNIYEANPDGTGTRLLLANVRPRAIVADSAHGHVYFDEVDNSPSLRRVNLDGSGVVSILPNFFFSDFAIDHENGKIYHSDVSPPIFRTNLDGSNGMLFYNPPGRRDLFFPQFFIDSENEYLYWTNSYETVYRVHFDGTGFSYVGPTPLTYHSAEPGIRANAMAFPSGNIYTIGREYPAVLGVDVIGGSSPTFHSIPGVWDCDNLTVDEEGGHIYFKGSDLPVGPANLNLYRASLDGSNVIKIVANQTGAYCLDTQEINDANPPVVTIFSPFNGTTNNQIVTISAEVSDDTAISTVTWLHDGVEQGNPDIFDGIATVTGVVLHPGANILAVRATDVAGNETEAEVTVTWNADRSVTVSSAGSVVEGQRTEFAVVLDSNGDVGGMTLELHYDTGRFRDATFEEGSALAGLPFTLNGNAAGDVTLTFASPGAPIPSGNQTLMTLSLRAKSIPGAALETAIDLDVQDVSDGTGDPLTVGTFVEGSSIEILRRLYTGDANTNGVLDTGDATLMQKMLAGIDPPQSWDQLLNDLNGSSTLDSGDVIRTLRAVTGADPQPGPASPKQARAKGVAAKSFEVLSGPRVVLAAQVSHAAAGENFQIMANLVDPESAISGAALTVDYPVEALRLVNAASHGPGPVVTGNSFVLWNVLPSINNYSTQTGTIRFAASAPSAWPGSGNGGTLAQLTFVVQPEASSQPAWEILLQESSVSSPNGYDVSSLPSTSRLIFVSAPISFAEWQELRFSPLELMDSEISGWAADSDGNGLPNGAEYMLGPNSVPTEGDYLIDTSRSNGGADGSCFELHFTRDVRAIEGTIVVEVSTDGITWSQDLNGSPAMEFASESINYATGARTVTFQSRSSISDAPSLFVRLVFVSP